MALGNLIEFERCWNVLQRPPGRDRGASARREDAAHFAQRGGLIGKELQALMTREQRKSLVVRDRQRRRMALSPLDRWFDTAGDSEHRRSHIDADDSLIRTKSLACHSGGDTSAARDVDEAVTVGRSQACDQLLRKWPEQRPHEHP